jgi:hypothetical protein
MMLRRLIATSGAALLLPLVASAGAEASSHVLWEQDFSESTNDWSDATLTGEGTAGVSEGAFSRFGEYRSEWPGDYVAELDVYLDPAWSVGTGFDYTVASSSESGGHLRDFVFHVGVTATGLRVIADNNTYGIVNAFILNGAGSVEVTSAGWYTMQHVFRDDNGVLAVDLNLLDASGAVVYSTTRSDPADVMTNVGGNRYGWFPVASGSFVIDNQVLYVLTHEPATKDDCRQGGYEDFGFPNQGACIASVVANENAGK